MSVARFFRKLCPRSEGRERKSTNSNQQSSQASAGSASSGAGSAGAAGESKAVRIDVRPQGDSEVQQSSPSTAMTMTGGAGVAASGVQSAEDFGGYTNNRPVDGITVINMHLAGPHSGPIEAIMAFTIMASPMMNDQELNKRISLVIASAKFSAQLAQLSRPTHIHGLFTVIQGVPASEIAALGQAAGQSARSGFGFN